MPGSLKSFKTDNQLKLQRPSSQCSLGTASLNLSLTDCNLFSDLDEVFDKALKFIGQEENEKSDMHVGKPNQNSSIMCNSSKIESDDETTSTIPDDICQPDEISCQNIARYFEKLKHYESRDKLFQKSRYVVASGPSNNMTFHFFNVKLHLFSDDNFFNAKSVIKLNGLRKVTDFSQSVDFTDLEKTEDMRNSCDSALLSKLLQRSKFFIFFK